MAHEDKSWARRELLVVAVITIACGPDNQGSGDVGTEGSTAAPNSSGDDDGGSCNAGSQGCGCYGNGTCDAGLVCNAGTCLPTDCRDGTVDCPCYGNATCNDGLECGTDGVCHPASGSTGNGSAGDSMSVEETTSLGDDTTSSEPSTGSTGSSETTSGDTGDPGCGNVPADMICVPAATFAMGTDLMTVDGEQTQPDEHPEHDVTISSSFWIDVTEVTASAYAMCWGMGVCSIPVAGGDHTWAVAGEEDHPINGVTWYQAVEYCEWLGKRLPTEAEWELAARGTDGRIYPWGNAAPTCAHVVSDSCGTNGTEEVGSHPAGDSFYGLHDMAGNVGEWTADFYQADYYYISPAVDPLGPDDGSSRVARSTLIWIFPPVASHRATYRAGYSPLLQNVNTAAVGFRCAQTPP